MARLSALLVAFVLGAAAAVALVACGSGEDADLLPGTTANQIESNLTRVEELADEGDCIGAEDAVAEVTAEVEELQGVDLKLKAALQEGTAKLSEAVGRCEEETVEEETEPVLEEDIEPEEVEAEEKPKKEKPEKEDEEPVEPDEPVESGEGAELPPQSNGKGEEKSGSAPPAAEPDIEEAAPPSSGGISPGKGVE
jgi:outer membrane biosynthesis protein TonB